jgi:serine/threonine-protein kinase HipA
MASTSDRCYVWVWLPGAADPVACGVLERRSPALWFHYGRGYLDRPDAVSLYEPVLPLEDRWFGPPIEDLALPGPLRDAAPDAWGRRVVLNRLTGRHGRDADVDALDELTYLMESASDRFGAVDFQASPEEYVPRSASATLAQLQRVADLVAAGEPLDPALVAAALGGTSLGGARPKAAVADGGRSWLAKFSTSDDTLNWVGAEAAATFLAGRAGLRVPEVRMARANRRDVLLTERFDRTDGGRHMAVSGLTLLGLGQMTARYGSYPELLDQLALWSDDPAAGAELFGRIAFNIAVSNNDDHLRNHAALWDGRHLRLAPAFDLAPQPRSGETCFQAIPYGRQGERESALAPLIAQAAVYNLTRARARAAVDQIVEAIRAAWPEAADFARLTTADRATLYGRLILPPAVFR